MKQTEKVNAPAPAEVDPIDLPENAFTELGADEEYRPVMHPARDYAEVTPYSVITGLILAVIFSAAAGYLKRLKAGERFIHPAKQAVARGFEESFILTWIRGMNAKLLSCQVRVYGLFLFSFALYSAIAYVFRAFFVERGTGGIDIGLIVTLILMVIASVGLISARCTLAEALLGSSASCFFLFRVVGLRRENFENIGEIEGKFNVAFIAGLICGAASYFVSPVYILIAAAGLIAAYLVLSSPEFGVLAIITLLPFAPTMALVAAVLYTSLCFLLKAM